MNTMDKTVTVELTVRESLILRYALALLQVDFNQNGHTGYIDTTPSEIGDLHLRVAVGEFKATR